MPWNLERFYGGGDLHFITCSCYHRRPFLDSARRRDSFLTVLEQVRQRYSFVVVGYVVMPEHFHLLISEPERGDPSVVIQALKVGFVRRVIIRIRPAHQNPGEELAPTHIWQRRFYDFNVWSKQKRIEKLRYIHRNPVKRGLVEKPEQWHWSSFRSYAYAEVGPVRVNDWTALKMKIRAA
jgi:putative transposase